MKVITLLFIDGNHSEAAVTHDVQTWLPLVSELGLVAFHDCVRLKSVDSAIRNVIKPRQVEFPVSAALYTVVYMKNQFNGG